MVAHCIAYRTTIPVSRTTPSIHTAGSTDLNASGDAFTLVSSDPQDLQFSPSTRGIVVRFLGWYEREREQHRFLTDMTTIAVSYSLGDWIASAAAPGGTPSISALRLGMLGVLSAINAVAAPHLFETVDREIPLRHRGDVRQKARRALYDSFLISPFWSLGHLAMLSLAEGSNTSVTELVMRTIGLWFPTLIFKLPLSYFIHSAPPLRQRLLASSAANVIWQGVASALT